jgi:ribonuclease P protein component
MPSPLAHPRVGIVVPKRGRTTVDRNRLKRRLRELVRLYILPSASAIDVVIRARDEAYAASFPDLRGDLSQAVERLRSAFRHHG